MEVDEGGTYINDIRWKSFILNITLSSKIVSGTSFVEIGNVGGEVLKSLIREDESRGSKVKNEKKGEKRTHHQTLE